MDREFLLEIGCEELPASWLPGLTSQLAEVVDRQLREHRLAPEAPAETFSTPRRLMVHVARVPERQTDLEELINGPPVAAAFRPDGTPTPAVAGFAAKHGVDVSALERVSTPKGEYVAFRKRQRGKTTVDVLPGVLAGTLRGLSFPKQMHWDATLDDGRGELMFGRPIRWLLFLYGGRVVPFTIGRTSAAQSHQVQDVSSGAFTYGHRFLTTSGRAGRAIKVRSFDEYRARLLENFVILGRRERHERISRELDAKARRLKGRVSRSLPGDSGLLDEVPDLVEYPSVIAGTFGSEFTEALPEEVLTTTLIHHQHYFPVEGEDGRLKPAFLAVINTEPENERTIASNAERVVTARLRDAMFFWDADRRIPLESRVGRLATLLFHKKLGTYLEKSERIARLAERIAREALGASEEAAKQAALAARLSKADLTTDMVRELTELQGTMGGIYAREDGLPEEVWKAIYFHYLPVGVDADAPPSKTQLGKATMTWAAVSLADKLDTIVGLFATGKKPTGSRDPYALRRTAQSVVKILVDLRATSGVESAVDPKALVDRAFAGYEGALRPESGAWHSSLMGFLWERTEHLYEQRGSNPYHARAIWSDDWALYHIIKQRLEDWKRVRDSEQFKALAAMFKRVKNITNDKNDDGRNLNELKAALREPAELALANAMIERWNLLGKAASATDFEQTVQAFADLQPFVDRFFKDVLVMADDARLMLLVRLRRAVIQSIGDISVIASDEKQT